MFNFLKEKLKSAVSKISSDVEEEPKKETKEKPKQEKPEETPKEALKPTEELMQKAEKSFLSKVKEKITTKKINEKQFDDLFWNLEVILLENNMAVEVIEKIKSDLKENLVDKPIPRGDIEKTVSDSLKQTLNSLFDVEKIDLLKKSEEKKPLVICFVGINGSGKTTTIAKVCRLFRRLSKVRKRFGRLRSEPAISEKHPI